MFLKHNLPAIAWAVFIVVLMLMPGQHIPKVNDDYLLSLDKVAHVFVFLVLVYLMIRGFRKQDRFFALRTKSVQSSLIIAGSFSLILETLQFTTSERTVDVYDAIANLIGCVLGYFAYRLMSYLFHYS